MSTPPPYSKGTLLLNVGARKSRKQPTRNRTGKYKVSLYSA